jgi:hypothetical protein
MNHERHPGVRGHGIEQLFERLEAAGRRADPDDRESAIWPVAVVS